MRTEYAPGITGRPPRRPLVGFLRGAVPAHGAVLAQVPRHAVDAGEVRHDGNLAFVDPRRAAQMANDGAVRIEDLDRGRLGTRRRLVARDHRAGRRVLCGVTCVEALVVRVQGVETREPRGETRGARG